MVVNFCEKGSELLEKRSKKVFLGVKKVEIAKNIYRL